jgi:hypothetical protein
MKYLKITNNGELDIRLVALMGGTTKSKDKFKIGQFGTGLKYTLAFLYRNNLDFKIFVGTEEVKLHTEKEIIRDETFEIICINGQRTSITTKMGEDWLAWMIIRELWCNALDEGGALKEETEIVEGEVNKTTFFIQIDGQIAQVIKGWGKYFIHDTEPIWQNSNYRIYPGGNKLRIYKQGVLIHEDDSKPATFAYDVLNADINELREFKGITNYEIANCLSNLDCDMVRVFLDTMKEDSLEYLMDWNWYQNISEGWREAIGTGKVITAKTLQTLKDRGSNPDEAALIIVPETLYKKLCTQFENVGATYVAGIIASFYEDYDQETENKIKQGLVILESCGYNFHPELGFVYGYFEDKTTLAKINMKTQKIYVSKALLSGSLFDIVSMLIEENEHFNTGFNDHTREFQTHFINLFTKQILERNQIEI